MATNTVRACVRCHSKKTKCSGYPSCRACAKAGANCEPYTRHRKGDSLAELKYFRQRTIWLEDEMYQNFHIQCKDVPTGSSLRPENPGFLSDVEHGPSEQLLSPGLTAPSTQLQEMQGHSTPAGDGADIGILALNATGEMRYLGPSSGAFFAAYASALARSCISTQNVWNRSLNSQQTKAGKEKSFGIVDDSNELSSHDIDLFLASYKMWIQPLYPILNSDDLDILVTRYNEGAEVGNLELDQGSEKNTELMLFYLVMALGAINEKNTINQIRIQSDQNQFSDLPTPRPSSISLCTRVLHLIDYNSHRLHPNIGFIQVILLISIYSSYGPIGSSQWQLAGFAMRMAVETGLYCTPKAVEQPDVAKDQRTRLFWTIYTIEVSLAYNLGRPPSIGEEHVAAELPKPTEENLFSLHHVRHRQIQSRVVAQIYGVNSRTRNMVAEKKQMLILDLQEELDVWQSNIPADPQSSTVHPYPYSYWNRLYHGTTFVLHRSSPLCPHPPVQSLERCIRSAGSYIDEVLKLLRVSNIPLSWMLVQGVLFAGLTMLVTARTGLRQLMSHVGASFLLIDLHSWTRNCSICLAIMNERLQEELLSKLDTHFETLANDTLRIISSSMASQVTDRCSDSSARWGNIGPAENTLRPDQSFTADRSQSDMNFGEEWDYFDIFKELMGQDPAQTFWDIFPQEMDMQTLTSPSKAQAGLPPFI